MLKNIKQLYSSYNLNNIIAVFIVTLLTLSFAACSKEDAPIAPEKEVVDISNGKAWSVSVSAVKGVQNSQTKSVKQNSSEGSLSVEDGWEGKSKENSDNTKLLYLTNSDKTLEFCWDSGEIIEVYINNGAKVGELRVNNGGDNEAILRGFLDDNTYFVGLQLNLYAKGKDRDYNNQKGTLEDIGRNFDYASATVYVTAVDHINKTISLSNANFTSLQSINRISISTGYAAYINKVTISGSGLVGESVTVIPENSSPYGTLDLFVALSNSKDKKITYNFTIELSNGKVVTTYKKANLKDGKYYKATISSSAVYETTREPLTIESLEDGGTITISNPKGKKFYYAINDPAPDDGFDSSIVISDANPIKISVNEGDRVQLYGSSFNSGYGSDYAENSTEIGCDVPHYVYGNANSLRHHIGWWTDENSKEVSDYMFTFMFGNDPELLSHPSKKIILPAKKVGFRSYNGMFATCKKMTTPPDLPATTLANSCYESMFSGCTRLQYAPELPATTLADACYSRMFNSCYSLESSPILPAKNLPEYSYRSMFAYCYNIRQITCYAEYIGATSCLYDWVKGVSSTGIFIKSESSSWPSGNNGIPTGWTNDEPFTIEAIADGDIVITNPQSLRIKYSKTISLNNAVSENSTTITIPVKAGDKVRFWGNNSAYGNVIERYLCTTIKGTAEHYAYGDLRSLLSDSNYPNITTLEEGAFCQLFLCNTELKSHPTLELRFGVSSVGNYACSQMFFGCSKLERAPNLTATTIGTACYDNMFADCEQLTKVPAELPSTTIAEECYVGMFAGCINLVNAPALPATTLKTWCYGNMFDACISLQNAPELKAGRWLLCLYVQRL